MAMDKDTASFSPLQWVRVLVKSEGRDLPSSLLGGGRFHHGCWLWLR